MALILLWVIQAINKVSSMVNLLHEYDFYFILSQQIGRDKCRIKKVLLFCTLLYLCHVCPATTKDCIDYFKETTLPHDLLQYKTVKTVHEVDVIGTRL